MTNLQKRLDSVIAKTNRKLIDSNQLLPKKTDKGILVGNVLIASNGPIKNLYKNDQLIYAEVSLNVVAIRLANLLAKNLYTTDMNKLYNADQRYGKWFCESQFLRSKYEKSLSNMDYDRADIFWARYSESRERALGAKRVVESLLDF
jgi:hypothetical protein